MTTDTLAQRVAAQYRAKAAWCERAAEQHRAFGSSKHADTYEAEAAEWRGKAEQADKGNI